MSSRLHDFNELFDKYEYKKQILITENNKLKDQISNETNLKASLDERINGYQVKLRELKAKQREVQLEIKLNEKSLNKDANDTNLMALNLYLKDLKLKSEMLKMQNDFYREKYGVDFKLVKEKGLLIVQFTKSGLKIYVQFHKGQNRLNVYFDETTLLKNENKKNAIEKHLNEFNSMSDDGAQNLNELLKNISKLF